MSSSEESSGIQLSAGLVQYYDAKGKRPRIDKWTVILACAVFSLLVIGMKIAFVL